MTACCPIDDVGADAPGKIFKFWSTQPVLKPDDFSNKIDADVILKVEPSQINKEPLELPQGLEWTVIDTDDPSQLKEVQTLIYENYVEDATSTFRLIYSSEFLSWALKSPSWAKCWKIGVRLSENKLLVAFIGGTPSTVRIYDKTLKIAKVNFLCVNKKIRNRRLTPFLIKELTRVINLCSVYVAIFTAGTYVPTPVCTSRYYHRMINTVKLVKTGFAAKTSSTTLCEMINMYKLPRVKPLNNFRAMKRKDIPRVRDLLNSYYSKIADIAPVFTNNVVSTLIPIPGVIHSYVVEEDNTITDFISFFCITTHLITNTIYSSIEIAYMYYHAPKGLAEDIGRLKDLIMCALIEARDLNLDAFNCLENMQTPLVFEDLKFRTGDGALNYNLYNYKCPRISPSRNGMVLL